MIEENEAKPEAEQLDRDEFTLDLEERDRLGNENKHELNKLREEIELKVLAEHCRAEDRDLAEIEVTHLSPVVAAADGTSLEAVVESHRPPQMGAAAYARAANAATVSDHVGRFRELAEAGVQTAIVAMPPVATVAAVERFAPVVEAFT